MRNVYDQVQAFYEDVPWEFAVKRDWVEGFLRQKAWQGLNDKELRELWRELSWFLQFLIQTEQNYYEDIEDISMEDYSMAIEWMGVHSSNFKPSLKNVKRWFSVLLEFYRYLLGKKIILDIEELEKASEAIAGGKKLNLFKPGLLDSSKNITVNSNISLDSLSNEESGEAIERLMNRLGTYFQQHNFEEDFERALFIYTGPLESAPEDEYDEFWLGFWDYFLFDYHLLADDITPLMHFKNRNIHKLPKDEAQFLNELLNAHFTVFYIKSVISQQWVECVNLFTNELFNLPIPDLDYQKFKKLVFFGHVFSKDMVIINYVTSMELSINLRKRIKEEVIKQKAIFDIQNPEAVWDDFFHRHAVAVRHTFNVMGTFAKVNITPFANIERNFPTIIETRVPNQKVMQLIDEVMPQYAFSAHDIELAKRMWHDYNQLEKVTVRKAGVWSAAVIYAYAQVVNSLELVHLQELAEIFAVSASAIRSNRDRLSKVMTLEKYDPRYINEEGFILSLFNS